MTERGGPVTKKPMPDPSEPLLEQYWAGAAQGRLVIPFCGSCSVPGWPPREICIRCGATEWQWRTVEPLGELYSWTEVHRATLPGFDEEVPYIVGIVELRDHRRVRLVGRVVELEGSSLSVGMTLLGRFTIPEDGIAFCEWAREQTVSSDSADDRTRAEAVTLVTSDVRAWIGHVYPPAELLVARRDIQLFARAIGLRDPIYSDVNHARQLGFDDVPAPPTFCTALRVASLPLVPRDELAADGTAFDDLPPVPLKRMMVGQTDMRFHGTIVAGDVITVTRRIADIYEKSGRDGPLVFIVFENSLAQNGKLVAQEFQTAILY